MTLIDVDFNGYPEKSFEPVSVLRYKWFDAVAGIHINVENVPFVGEVYDSLLSCDRYKRLKVC